MMGNRPMKVYETQEVKDAFDVSSFFKKMKMQYGAKKTDIELLVSSDERNCERIVAVFKKELKTYCRSL